MGMRPIRLLATAAVLLILVGGCDRFAAGRTYELVLQQPEAFEELPVRVVDSTGLVSDVAVRDAEVLPPFDGRGGLSSPPGRPNELLVQWVGGACDERVEIAVSRGGEGRLHLELQTAPASQDCDAIGVGRAVWLVLLGPVDPSEANLDFAE
jgi:hypothetical protein